MTRAIFIIGVIVALASTVALVAAMNSSSEETPLLTHTVTRGDLQVTVVEQGLLESSDNVEIKCKVRGRNTVLWVIDSGSFVQPGDELVRLDASFINEQIDERTKYAHWSQSAADHSAARLTSATLAVEVYQEGQFVAQLMALEKNLAVAQTNLTTAQNILEYTQVMSKSGYRNEEAVKEQKFAVDQAKLEVDLKKTQIDVLKEYTQAEQMQTLKGRLASTKATHEANVERAAADASRRDRALEELPHCVVRAERAGLVIHPNAARWRNAPEIAQGISVHKDQVLLLMPDLSKMQVKIGVKEAVVDRVTEGQQAVVKLPEQRLAGTVASVASVTRPAGWWTANEVRYDTLIDVPSQSNLRPGMSAEVELAIATYRDVLTIPVAAIVEVEDEHFCWVVKPTGTERCKLTLGDTNDVFTIVTAGLQVGDQVLLNPPQQPASPQDTTPKDA